MSEGGEGRMEIVCFEVVPKTSERWYICGFSVEASSRWWEHRHRFWHATLRLRSAICRHRPSKRVVLSQICCFGERKVVFFQMMDGAEPRDAGTTSLSSSVCQRGG